MKIGLTGGIASGKSTVAAMLQQRGARIIDADQLARDVVLPGEPALAAIREAFGDTVLTDEGTLNRPRLGELVFQQPDKLKQLENILHPVIRQRMREQIAEHEADNPSGLVVADIPLLFETGQESTYRDKGILVVYIPQELQVERLMARGAGMDREQAEKRVSLQMDIEEKRRRADWVIDNSGSIGDTERQVEQFLRSIGQL